MEFHKPIPAKLPRDAYVAIQKIARAKAGKSDDQVTRNLCEISNIAMFLAVKNLSVVKKKGALEKRMATPR